MSKRSSGGTRTPSLRVHCSGLNLKAPWLDAGLLHEVLDLVGLGVDVGRGRDVVLDAGQHSQFAFDGDVVLVGVLDDLAREFDVLLVGVVAAVDHDGAETGLDAGLGQLEGVAMVQVQDDGDLVSLALGVLDRTLGQVAQEGAVGVLAGAR
jgi:hypothetical protein